MPVGRVKEVEMGLVWGDPDPNQCYLAGLAGELKKARKGKCTVTVR
jgi:hypothetical protein